ncbi:MAG: class I SAM-dependent methyltransferase [Thermoleophilia bacterium]|nr:class I SAM-dependent methyltransferase [Thermoleophilia bacterium]
MPGIVTSSPSRAAAAVPAGDRDAERSIAFLRSLFGDPRGLDFAVRLWTGETWGAAPGAARFTLVLRHPGALRAMFLPPTELALAEAYVFDDLDVEGDLEQAFATAAPLLETPLPAGERARRAARLLALPRRRRARGGARPARLRGRRHSRARDRAAVAHHYDVPAKFFRLFLDEKMVYSCAYFLDPEDDLDAAQEQKLEHVCRKLRLREGDRLLDVGCGWGALVLHAARHHGVEAVGITVSRPQAELAAERIERAGLARRCRVSVCDYRELDEPGRYDRVVSVGMFEHVGERRLPEYFRVVSTLLRPGGTFLNHGIARLPAPQRRRGPSFVGRYVFPDGELVPLATTLAAAEGAGLEPRDVESLREHYALTLRAWVRRLEARREDAVRTAGEPLYRIWRLYMAASAHAFARGRLNVYQALFAKPDAGRSGLPLTRADWYRA